MKILLLSLTACMSLIAAPARAQIISADKDYSSPRRFYFEFKLGPFAPSIDDEFSGGTGPFEHIFGDGQDLMIKGELDVQVWQGFGSIAIGGLAGYYTTSATPFPDTSSSGGASTSTDNSTVASTTSISLVPLALLGIYRFDWPAIKYRVPLVPFVKLGINYTFWWIDIDDRTATYNGTEASGGTWGWQFNAGVAFLLDVLEPTAAKVLDVEVGINHTYLFFEFAHVDADSFGSDTGFGVGDTTWQAGIAFEF